MQYFNYIIKDRQTHINYALTMSNGLFNWFETPDTEQVEPVVRDIITGQKYRIFIENNVQGQEATNDPDLGCILYDSILNVYWKLFFTDGIFSQDLTIPPIEESGGSKGFYPIEHYYKFLMNEYNIELAFTAIGYKKFKRVHKIIGNGKKSKKKEVTGYIKGKKKFLKEDLLCGEGKRKITKQYDFLGEGRKKVNKEHLFNGSGIKVIRNKEQLFEGSGERNLTPILEALDII